MGLHVYVSNGEDWLRVFSEIGMRNQQRLNRAKARNRLWNRFVVPELKGMFAENFRTEGQSWSGGWAPNSDQWTGNTLSDRVGHDTGIMEGALVHEGPGLKKVIHPSYMTYGIDGQEMPYPAWFHEGYNAKLPNGESVDVPARRLWPEPSGDSKFFQTRLPETIRAWAISELGDAYANPVNRAAQVFDYSKKSKIKSTGTSGRDNK